MSKWIEVEPLMDKAKEYGGYYEDTVYAVPLADISEAPSIDLVRCGECKKADTRKCPFYSAGWGYTDKDYCSCGERKESE